MKKLQEVKSSIGQINQQIQQLVERREVLVHEYVNLAQKEGKPVDYQEIREKRLFTCSGCHKLSERRIPDINWNPSWEYYCQNCRDKGIDAYEHGDDIMFAYPKGSKIKEWKKDKRERTVTCP